jgi:hypothetical protein
LTISLQGADVRESLRIPCALQIYTVHIFGENGRQKTFNYIETIELWFLEEKSRK